MHLNNTEAQAEQVEWTEKLGEPVKFIDEQAVLEAHQQGTCFPMLYYGRLIDVFLIRFHSKHIPYAQIKPFWDAPDKFIPLSKCAATRQHHAHTGRRNRPTRNTTPQGMPLLTP